MVSVVPQIEISRMGDILRCTLTGKETPDSLRLVFLDIASCCIEHGCDRLLFEDRSSYLDISDASDQQVFELSLCFSEWFRGKQIAYVYRRADFDLGLGILTCQANQLQIEGFVTVEQGVAWLGRAAGLGTPRSIPGEGRDLARLMN